MANGFLDAHTCIARGGVFANVQTGRRDLLRDRRLGGQMGRGTRPRAT
ncbi:MAG TPA: hypothetical protein VGA66_16315 [Mycobacterium sp.]